MVVKVKVSGHNGNSYSFKRNSNSFKRNNNDRLNEILSRF